MKKKVLSLMAIVLFASTLISAAPSVEFEEYGDPSDCVRYWRNAVLTLAANNGYDPNAPENIDFYMNIYMTAYTNCVNN